MIKLEMLEEYVLGDIGKPSNVIRKNGPSGPQYFSFSTKNLAFVHLLRGGVAFPVRTGQFEKDSSDSKGELGPWNANLLTHGDKLALLKRFDRAFLLDHGFRVDRAIPVEWGEGVLTPFDDSPAHYHIIADSGVGTDGDFPVIVGNGYVGRYNLYAHYKFGASANEVSVGLQSVKALDVTDFSGLLDPTKRGRPELGHVLIRQGRTFAFARERYHYSGDRFSALIELDQKGRVIGECFVERYWPRLDETLQGKDGRFTRSGEYCILGSAFRGRQDDSWHGAQKLYSFHDEALVDLELPKGFGRFKVYDHLDYFWLYHRNTKTKVVTILQCEGRHI